ncbi:cobalamin-5'-phosphate synthase [Actinacidiphila guanduensis]|uniref:Adenosylcobinamide-GDP ribazoletransferase n=1 Tax=Actinacidiphila guanduensis TaxID=310781 RepID=A0A1H0DFR4_9ACTN|nr:cobalamin-5'-phosphate synthase [Actinacidiphila guanduensis]
MRFAVGVLSVVPVRAGRWDREAARGGMAAAPLVGAGVGGFGGAVGAGIQQAGGSGLLAGIAAVGVGALLTRGLHLDGLADTADALGSGKPPEQALDVMKRSDIGPFGVVTLVLVLLAQTASLAACYAHGWTYGLTAAALAGLMGRAAITAACRRGVPAARPGGLGAMVAEVLPPATAWTVAAACTAAAAAAGTCFGGLTWLRCTLAALTALTCAEALLRRCRRRLSGVTGDVFGALCETAATAALLVLSTR